MIVKWNKSNLKTVCEETLCQDEINFPWVDTNLCEKNQNFSASSIWHPIVSKKKCS